MDEHLYDDLIEEIREKSMEIDGVLETEKCFVRKHGMRYFVDLHLVVNGNIPVKEGHRIGHDVQEHLIKSIDNLENVLVHIEPDSFD